MFPCEVLCINILGVNSEAPWKVLLPAQAGARGQPALCSRPSSSPQPWFSWRLCGGQERGTSFTNCPATLRSRLPCPGDILAPSASLFLGLAASPGRCLTQTLKTPLLSKAMGPFPGPPLRLLRISLQLQAHQQTGRRLPSHQRP